MGHQRLGKIPKSKKWQAVVQEVVGGEGLGAGDIGRIAALTLDAAGPALEKAANDPGFRHTVYLLTQIALASREADWQERLGRAGIQIGPEASLFDLTTGLHAAIDRHVEGQGRSTDIGEMAQQAAGSALASLAGSSAATLFGSGGEHLQAAIRQLSTRAGFSRLGQRFFGRFLTRFLNFYLSRITASNVGSRRLADVGFVSDFNAALQTHCEQSARIVRDVCGGWYSKTEYEEGISPENTSRFVAAALDKLSNELGKQGAEG